MPEVIRIQSFFIALPLAFGVLHLFLWAAMPRLRSNLYYGLFLLFIASTIFFDFQGRLAETSSSADLMMSAHRSSLAIAITLLLRFLYEVFAPESTTPFRYLAAALLGTAFARVAGCDPGAVVDHLRGLEEEWRGDAPQEDDLTLLVLKAMEA